MCSDSPSRVQYAIAHRFPLSITDFECQHIDSLMADSHEKENSSLYDSHRFAAQPMCTAVAMFSQPTTRLWEIFAAQSSTASLFRLNRLTAQLHRLIVSRVTAPRRKSPHGWATRRLSCLIRTHTRSYTDLDNERRLPEKLPRLLYWGSNDSYRWCR